MINPAIVEGQIRGGVARGVGAVFYEKTTYTDDGQPRAGTFLDYLIPTTMEIPRSRSTTSRRRRTSLTTIEASAKGA